MFFEKSKVLIFCKTDQRIKTDSQFSNIRDEKGANISTEITDIMIW